MRTRAVVLLPLLLGLGRAALAASALDAKPYGVLLLGQGGADLWSRTAVNGDDPWSRTVADARKALGDQVPVEFAQGEADERDIQQALDSLESQRVRKIVAVPLFLTSQSPVLDQTRFLLGLREKPSQAFLDAPHSHLGQAPRRLSFSSPLVMSKALDDDDLLAQALAARAKTLSRRPANETLVLIGQPPASQDGSIYWAGVMSSLARKAAARAELKGGQAMALLLESGQDAQDRSERELGQSLRRMRTAGDVLVLPVALSSGQENLSLSRLLDGAFVRYDGAPLLPDPRIVQWIRRSAESAAALPDMRLYKDGKGLPPAPPLTFEHKLTLDSHGEKP